MLPEMVNGSPNSRMTIRRQWQKMPASFAYGRRDGRLLHVLDLDETHERGLRCGCVCPECGRQLQAHLGVQKAWHFQHHVEDANCNPQPMTLLHAFVRDELARRKTLEVPAVVVYCELDVLGQVVPEFLHVPAEKFVFTGSEAEARGDGVQPDVVFTREDTGKLALEVRYSHAVDAEKLQRLHRSYGMAVEFDVSDLPSGGVSTQELERALQHGRRWTWLINGRLRLAESRARAQHEWMRSAWKSGLSFTTPPEVRPANQKLKLAQKRLAWAQTALLSLRHQALSPEEAIDWLAGQDKVDRVALACAVLRLQPQQLPTFLQQFLPRDKPAYALGHHPYSWQPVVFMKFGVGTREFSAHDAADWCVRAMPDRCEMETGVKSINGFTRTAAALHLYFLQLETQNLLQGAAYVARDSRTFTPRFANVARFKEYLATLDA